MHTMDWSKERVLTLIDEYRARPCLWDSTCSTYNLINKKNEAWKELAEVMDSDVPEIKKKLNSVLASFRRERAKDGVKKSGPGAGTEEVYHSTWFAFKSLQFLMEKFRSRRTKLGHSEDDSKLEDGIDTEIPDDENQVENFHSEISITTERYDDDNYEPPPSGQKRKRTNSDDDPRIGEAVQIIKDVSDSNKTNINSKFGEYIASKLNAYSGHCRNIVHHLISNILFEADMGKFDMKGASSAQSYTTHFQASPYFTHSQESTPTDTRDLGEEHLVTTMELEPAG